MNKKTHLIFGLGISGALLMFVITGYLMILSHGKEHPEPERASRTVTLSDQYSIQDERDLRRLRNDLDLKGRIGEPNLRDDGTTRVDFNMPQKRFEVVLSEDGAQAEITTVTPNALGIISGLHRIRGFHGGPLYKIWSVTLDLICIGLILLGVSGIVFWFRKRKKNPLGWVMLATGWGFSIWTFLYIMLSV